MAEIIKDGTGSGSTAKVDACNRLHTDARIVDIEQDAGLLGNAFDVSSPSFTINNTSTHAILYMSNNECLDLIVNTIFVDTS